MHSAETFSLLMLFHFKFVSKFCSQHSCISFVPADTLFFMTNYVLDSQEFQFPIWKLGHNSAEAHAPVKRIPLSIQCAIASFRFLVMKEKLEETMAENRF